MISAGTLALINEETRALKIIKTAEVTRIDDNGKKIALKSFPYYDPCFTIGEHIYIANRDVAFQYVPQIIDIKKKGDYTLFLSESIANLTEGAIIQQVVELDGKASAIGIPNCMTVRDVEITDKCTGIDVCKSTGVWEAKLKLIPPIPENLLDPYKTFLSSNPHIKLTITL